MVVNGDTQMWWEHGFLWVTGQVMKKNTKQIEDKPECGDSESSPCSWKERIGQCEPIPEGQAFEWTMTDLGWEMLVKVELSEQR